MESGKGLSINMDKMNANIQRYGGAFEVDLKSIPEGLELTNFPVGSSHFLISPIQPISPAVFQTQLNQVKLIQYNSILNGQ